MLSLTHVSKVQKTDTEKQRKQIPIARHTSKDRQTQAGQSPSRVSVESRNEA